MKKFVAYSIICLISLSQCRIKNDRTKDSSQDTHNVDSSDNKIQAKATDSFSSAFLKDVVHDGVKEISAANLALNRASNINVKGYATMIVNDHSAANGEARNLAKERNIEIVEANADSSSHELEALGKKNAGTFDKEFMKMMIQNHQNAINKFEKARSEVKDNYVSLYISRTLPKLKMHFDSALAINNRLR